MKKNELKTITQEELDALFENPVNDNDVYKVKLENLDIDSLEFNYDLHNCEITNCKFTDMNFHCKTSPNMFRCLIQDCMFTNVNFNGNSELERCIIINCEFDSSQFAISSVFNSIFIKNTFIDSKINIKTLYNCRISRFYIYSSSLEMKLVSYNNIRDIIVDNTHTILKRVYNCKVSFTAINNSNIEYANLISNKLNEISIHGCTITHLEVDNSLLLNSKMSDTRIILIVIPDFIIGDEKREIVADKYVETEEEGNRIIELINFEVSENIEDSRFINKIESSSYEGKVFLQ